jgi:hypothetical protein
MRNALEPDRLDELSATVGFLVKDTNKARVSALLASVRENVMWRADQLTIDSPPALIFDPR